MALAKEETTHAATGVAGSSKTRSNASRRSASVKSSTSPQKRVAALRGSATKGKGKETSDMSLDSGSAVGEIEETDVEGDDTIIGDGNERVEAGLTEEWVASVEASKKESPDDMESPNSSQTVAQLLTGSSQRNPSASNPTVVVNPAASSSPVIAMNSPAPTQASSSSFAAGLATLKTPTKNKRNAGPAYVRSPSGSALSSLAESPASVHVRKRHRFTLEIEQQAPGRKSPGGSKHRAQRSTSAVTIGSTAVATEAEVVVEEEDDNPFKNESSEDEKVVESSDSDGEDGYAQMRARAMAKMALVSSTSATTLTQTTIPESSASAPTDIVSPLKPKCQPNRASRSAAPRPKAVASTSNSTANVKVVPVVSGLKTMADIRKANERRVKKGFLTLEEAQELIDEDDDILHDPDDSDAEDRRSGYLTPAQLEKLSESVVLNEEHDETVTGSAKKRSSDIKNVLVKVLKKDLESRPKSIAEEKIRARSIWSWETEGPIKPLISIAEGNGWRERVVESFNNALLDSSSAISPMRLFSPITGIGSIADRQAVSAWLLAVVSHPSTPEIVAEQAIQLLHRIVIHAAKSELPSPLSLSDFAEEFKLFGAKRSILGATVANDGLAVSSSLSEIDDGTFTSSEREKSCIRLLRVLDDIASLSLIVKEELVPLLLAVLQVSLDPNGASTRRITNSSLHHLIGQLFVHEETELPRALFDRIVELYSGSERIVCAAVVEALPHASKPCKVFRKWVAWGLLSNRDVVPSSIQDASFFDPPPLRLAAALLENPQPESAFKITANMDDFALVASAQLMQVLLSDLGTELGDATSRKAIKKISKTLVAIDSSIRTNIRTGEPERHLAKNTIARLAQSLSYQVKAAEGRAGTSRGPSKVTFGSDESGSEEESKVVSKKRKVGQKKGTIL